MKRTDVEAIAFYLARGGVRREQVWLNDQTHRYTNGEIAEISDQMDFIAIQLTREDGMRKSIREIFHPDWVDQEYA